MNNIFWGIVEDRSTDPSLLMRYKVRVVGVHSPLKSDVSTADLPWAIPIQNNSAAMSGIGVSANGYLQGSTVAVIFADVDKQIPLILGAIAGIPGGVNENLELGGSIAEELNAIIPSDTPPAPVVTLPDGTTAAPETLTTIPSGATITEPGYIGTLTKTQVDKLKATIAFHESNVCPIGQGYTCVNDLGFLGKYQFGSEALETFGYIEFGAYKKVKSNAVVFQTDSYWKGKNGVTNKEAFLNNSAAQEECMDKLLKQNYTILVREKVITPTTPPENIAGALMAAHLVGHRGAVKYLKAGIDNGDQYGTTASKYFKLGYESVSGQQPTIKPSADTMEASNASSTNASLGFTDPAGKYPLAFSIGDPDTPNLSSGLKVSTTCVAEKEASRIIGVPIANSPVTWEQSNPPYNATYPFNHVTETESGHVFEMDDTPGSERIHTYHRTGTFNEIDAEGNETTRVKGTRTIIVDEDELVYIQGSGHVAVDGDLSLRVIKSVHIEVLGDVNMKVIGNLNQHVTGDWNIKVGGTARFDFGGNVNTKILKSHIISVGENFSAKIGQDSNVSIGGKNNQSSTTANLVTTGNFNVDASKGAGTGIFLNSSTSAPTITVPVSPVPALTLFEPTPKVPNPITKLEKEIVSYEGEESATRKKITGGEKVESSAADTTTVAPKPVVASDCAFDRITSTMTLTQNFRLKDLIDSDAKFPYGSKYLNLSDSELACNLKKLATNVLEPILAAFPDMYINSGFRSKQSTNGTSQHQLGQAADLGFRSARAISDYKQRVAKYREIAIAIRDMGLPIDQLIFEMDPAKKWVWIHVSFNDKAKLPRADGSGIKSYNGTSYVNGIIEPKWG